MSSATNSTYALSSDLAAKSIKIENSASGMTFTTTENDYNITLTGDFMTGGYNYTNHAQPVNIYFNDSTVSCVNMRALDQHNTNVTDNLYLGGSNISISRNFTAYYNDGTWTNDWDVDAGTSTVTLTSATEATIAGDTTFNNLTCTTAGKTLNFTAGSTQTVSGTFTLTGSDTSLITLQSTSAGTAWNLIDSSGLNSVNFVDAQDSDASSGYTINALNSTSSGNNSNWRFSLGGGPGGYPSTY